MLQILSMIMMGTPLLVRLAPLQPMRYLQLVYVFLALIFGAYLGRYLLKASFWRWTVFLVANCGMFLAQRQLFAGTAHLELPGIASDNSWLQAFDWVKHNTPEDAYFVLDKNYMSASGENNHGFRALAERSVLADDSKDAAVVILAPSLAPVLQEQLSAQVGWKDFQLADFERLKTQFGVNWALVYTPSPAGLICPWHNALLSVCKIP